ncbi:helix-turn-helix domain-containing protein [Nonomuraea phyllanthi]|uniref:Helix-turn-helix domain-containing protein n=1 Tax=Nonomuraea phyllanthi TaxID=2219224 RepID=A0A5C4W4L7_9ACTN|nr:GlxA family transcriptional regulator [Nonomuraea phyllanthi]KAB8191916.1 helix-turn-helix domain-containing protein [Nonomuraea phyllanthi]
MAGDHRVVFVVFDGMKMLDLAGPAEVFAEANLFGARYALRRVSPSGKPVLTSTGMELPVDGTAEDGPGAGPDTVIVVGGDVLATHPVPPELITTIQSFRPRARRMVSICTGSFALAAAGVLAGRRATTHWRHARLLACAHPDVHVQPDALFVEDDGVFTSAGVSAGIDLALALVEQDHGPDLARDVARGLVMFMQRPGGQSQFSAPLEAKPPRTPTLRRIVDLIAAQPALDHTVSTLARRVAVSPRHLARLFATELNTTPAKYVEQVRLDHAKVLLAAGHGVAETARVAGFGSAETMRRTFTARLGISPSQYRTRFATTGPGRQKPGNDR